MMQNMRLLQQMQEKLLKAQEELGNEVVEGTAGGGAVKIAMTGHQKVQSVTIDPEVVDPEDVEMLQDLVAAAINEAVSKSHELATKRLGSVTGGMKIPGLM
ncbi:MAG TPA: YbaB/EbfC family nucleoid-associated protein [Chloroflexota bacterium]|nr:YbaB/EbfC family nucleoid-associated protein [Chloroflexota bacterium]